MKKILLLTLLLTFSQIAFAATTATDLQFSGWIPYWAKIAGVEDVVKHLDNLDSISPFSYEVDTKGNLLDKGKKDLEPWKTLYKKAKQKDVEVIPSILWMSASGMHVTFSDSKMRKEHISQITNEILKDKRFAGVDIDYEGKWAETRDGFSQFLIELEKQVHSRNKILVCTIESRTPPEDLFDTVDADKLASIQYSNDYAVINRVCDQIKIMTYDQGAIDVSLNKTKRGKNMYAPVADVAWVEKVIKHITKDIAPEKIHLGLASYGYMFELTPLKGGGYDYRRTMAMNYPFANELAKIRGIVPTRNSAGELSYSYPVGTAGSKNITLAWYSDSIAMQQKIDLAKKYNLGGVAVFKFDGQHDEKFWDVIDTQKY